ncbi:YeeE/YedE family protein [Alkalicoccus chagannorensis]|uniref:YeeE/YedE family protein n=1 Tax=Alkalicoccus chagannorensis TaxID=427072 RepID=UPI0006853220|nr:YeeE/YedE family protein [Alkalicoccus chagannorensis]
MAEGEYREDSPQYIWTAVFLAAAVPAGVFAWLEGGLQFFLLYLIGFALGFTLFHTRYGFSAVYTKLFEEGNTEMLRGHMQKLIITVTLFALILGTGTAFFDERPEGAEGVLSFGLVFGAFLFGFGMNIGSNFSFSAMKTLRGGRTALLFTVGGFMTGAVIGAWHFPFWNMTLPHHAPLSIAEDTPLGYPGAWLLHVSLFAAAAFGTYWYHKKKRPPALPPLPRGTGWTEILFYTWPIWVGATVFAFLNALVLLVMGSPWKLTAAFITWGSHLFQFFGGNPIEWRYWEEEQPQQVLMHSVFADETSVLNLGILTGVVITMALAGLIRFYKIQIPMMFVSLAGGLLMGYGAAISHGANVGAYFSGLASMSLHAWIWTVMAVLGVWTAYKIGSRISYLRPN